MRIKKLELIGFKSFKDRTMIHFDAGITGIVGPNGCGKSNIVDALVWVMGEMSAKHLRGSSMEDVIFAGAENYAPMGYAEVSLTLENDGGLFPAQYANHSEVMVTRRLHRNGESEYLINKETARLKDIQEIFMDTGAGSKGFSIIEQGAIGKIITAKPEDRRSLIEEAAGITKFKARKKESQRKLQSTDQNLLRLQDITGELKRQIDSLQRQAQRAERYRNLKNQAEDLDLWLSSLQYQELAAKAGKAARLLSEAQAIDVSGETDLAGLQADLETLRLMLVEKEKTIESRQQLHYALQSESQKKEMQVQELRFEIEQARRSEQMTGTLLQEQKARLELLERDQAEFSTKQSSLKIALASTESLYQEKHNIFSGSQGRILEIDEDLTRTRREMFTVGQALSSCEAKFSSFETQIEEVAQKVESDQSLLAELQEKQTEFEGRRKKVSNELEKERQMAFDLSNDVESFEVNRKVLNASVVEKRTEVQDFKDQWNEVTSLLYGLENLQNSFEGFEEGVKSIMHWQKSRESHADGRESISFLPVSQLVEVPAQYEMAMEAALGTRLQMLVSQEHQSSVQAIDYLKEKKSGRSSFLTNDLISCERKVTSLTADSAAGVVAILADVVKSEKHAATVANLLQGIAVVENLRTAIHLRAEHPDWTFVTTDGDTLGRDGIITGGASDQVESGVLKRRREIKELSARKEEYAGKLALATQALKKLEAQLETLVNDFEGAKLRKQEQEIRLAELKKDSERAQNEFVNAQNAVERQTREVGRVQMQLSGLEEKCSEIQDQMVEYRSRKMELEEQAGELDQELQTRRLGFDGLQSEVTDLQVKRASQKQELEGLTRQLEMVERSLSSLQEQLSKMSEESSRNTCVLSEGQLKIEQERLDLEKLMVAVEGARTELSRDRNEFEIESHRAREIESKVNSLQRAHHEAQMKINETQLQLEQARLKEQYIVDQVRERYVLELPNILSRFEGREGDRSAAEVDLKDLREKISRIGEVNLSAIEEYEETSKRYEFLTQQQNDLMEAKDQLRKVIERINKICSKRFKETFEMVNERFTKVFPVLFGGGEARLELIEDVDSQEMGIEIVAKPPGKKMQSVTLMSGGEKALTAVALIFSIFLVKPSPYCLLDEVDAPLDDANVYRFNDLVREMAKRSQIIVVTHNKHTMDVVGKLYGVTMQERGVSTMVSVSLQDIG